MAAPLLFAFLVHKLIKRLRGGTEISAIAVALCLPIPALAQSVAAPGATQRLPDNAVADADDAFGTNTGRESSGIYNDNDTRGFSPLKAGNTRFDGIYFDPVGIISGRLRRSSAIRVGYAALDFPFPAPTGIFDNALRNAGSELVINPEVGITPYGGYQLDLSLLVPLRGDRLGVSISGSINSPHNQDGASISNRGFAAKPVLRFNDVEFSPFYSIIANRQNKSRPLTVVTGDKLPELPEGGFYLGEPWAKGRQNNVMYGFTLKAPMTDRLSLRGGVFRANQLKLESFSDLYTVQPSDPSMARHSLIADQNLDTWSWSGEVQLAWHRVGEIWQHRIIAGVRMRDRVTQSGGSAIVNYGTVSFGVAPDDPRPPLVFGAYNTGSLRQTSLMLGYIGGLPGVGRVNLGVQKVSYRARFEDASTGVATLSRDNPLIYNASLLLDVFDGLAVFGGTQTGLEDSGSAPDSATNRNEQLPATRTRQYEAGLRWALGPGTLVLSAFQITKPYFTFDGTGRYTELGDVRHRGIEVSLTGHFANRLTLLAGGVFLRPEVYGVAVDAGLVGNRPAGTPSQYVRIDAQYRTDLLGGFTPTASFVFQGARAAGNRPQASLGGKQLTLPSRTTLDIGFRQPLHIAGLDMRLLFNLQNLFNVQGWRVYSANTIQVEDRRRFMLNLSSEF